MTATPTAICSACGAAVSADRSRTDVDGRAWCEPCFNDLRVSEAAENEVPVPRFRCAACGVEHVPSELKNLAGQWVCGSCAAQTKPPAETSLNGNGSAPQQDRADEARQIVSQLHGSVPTDIIPRVTCPHCWHLFEPDQALWVSQHSELMGDPVLGPEAPARFLPSRFNASGEAFDGRDMPCQELACPRCHLGIPRALIETEPLFVSVVGAPGSGKSHLLASMTWELRKVLRDRFAITFNDADAFGNLSIQRYEETLFVSGDVDQLVAIRKTELQGELYDQIRLGQQIVSLPRPFLFTMRSNPNRGSSRIGSREAGERLRVLCLYDNAGEHFQPGMDSASAPGTQHLARSKVLIFLFDPTQHPGFREKCRSLSQDPQLYGSARTLRQETVLTEAAARVRRYTGLSPGKKHERPLLVVVSKADIWAPLLDEDIQSEPLLPDPDRLGTQGAIVDVPRIERTSAALRRMLMERTPEMVAAAEDFCRHILYIPSSALGRGPEVQEQTGMLGIRPRDIRPRWAAVPILYMFAKWGGGGAIPAARPAARAAAVPRPAAQPVR